MHVYFLLFWHDILRFKVQYNLSYYNAINVSLFIFSNAGGTNITAIALKFWAEGKTREDITLKDIEHLISRGAFNEVGKFLFNYSLIIGFI